MAVSNQSAAKGGGGHAHQQQDPPCSKGAPTKLALPHALRDPGYPSPPSGASVWQVAGWLCPPGSPLAAAHWARWPAPLLPPLYATAAVDLRPASSRPSAHVSRTHRCYCWPNPWAASSRAGPHLARCLPAGCAPRATLGPQQTALHAHLDTLPAPKSSRQVPVPCARDPHSRHMSRQPAAAGGCSTARRP